MEQGVSVGQLTAYIKNRIENDENLRFIPVVGEISNFVRHPSGHMYFSLKDEESQIKAVMFKGSNLRLAFRPENGMRVIAVGNVSVYEPRGEYQLVVSRLLPQGIGDLFARFEALKKKLSAEGLFDESHKKPLPKFPKKVGVVTSPSGAAVRDIMNIAERRCPLVQLVLYPALVQGAGTEEALIEGLDYFERTGADAVIIGRGGGSTEDLWGFNGERLARKIFSVHIPVVSAVGHETDFTICDFVADKRAPTPSAAAELVVPDIRTLLRQTDSAFDRIVAAQKARLHAEETALIGFQRTFSRRGAERALLRAETEFAGIVKRLEGLNPLAVLSRGFAVVQKDGETVKTKSALSAGDCVTLRFCDGEKRATIEEDKQ